MYRRDLFIPLFSIFRLFLSSFFISHFFLSISPLTCCCSHTQYEALLLLTLCRTRWIKNWASRKPVHLRMKTQTHKSSVRAVCALHRAHSSPSTKVNSCSSVVQSLPPLIPWSIISPFCCYSTYLLKHFLSNPQTNISAPLSHPPSYLQIINHLATTFQFITCNTCWCYNTDTFRL